ncbi:MAG: D-alanyl-D-alanine carboxypeptidase family protein [Alphaproteobacteria bacterium]
MQTAKSMRALAAAVALAVAAVVLRPAGAIEMVTTAREAILVDLTTGTVLTETNADELMPPASMSKLMTVHMIFSRLADGRLHMDDEMTVTENAWRRGGSSMFLEIGQRVRVEDLLRGIIVQSGNDACIVAAEAIAGSEAAFAEAMNTEAHEIGLTRSTFRNSTGWPDPQHLMTARDLAILASHIIQTFPDYYPIFAEREFRYNDITQQNRNPLLYRNMGADGLKTGHTEEAGYGLVGSVERDGRRLLLVINGMESQQARSDEAERLLEWGFREFEVVDLFEPGESVENAEVWLGERETVPLMVTDPIRVTIPQAQRDEMRVAVVYDGPVPAPIRRGDEVARLVVTAPGIEQRVFPVYAAADVAEAGVFGKIWATLSHFVLG